MTQKLTDELRNSAGLKILLPGVEEIIEELGESTIKLADGREYKHKILFVKGAYGYAIAQYCDDCQAEDENDFMTATIVWLGYSVSFLVRPGRKIVSFTDHKEMFEAILQEKYDEFYDFDEVHALEYDDPPIEDQVCPHGFAIDEDCDPESRRGVETCEVSCPFGRIR